MPLCTSSAISMMPYLSHSLRRAEFRKLHQFTVFASNTPVQYAIADFLQDPENYIHLSKFYQAKRDFFVNGIKNSRFTIVPNYGTYFQLLDYSAISKEKDMEFARRLVLEHKIASVPLSPFYSMPAEGKLLRFCFAKSEETLTKASEILCRI
jgi:methionine aminotransferase